MPSAISDHKIVLNLKNPNLIRLAVIETNLKISEQHCTVFHVMLEDDLNHFSLIRFAQDFKELDELLFKHFPKHRIPLPKLDLLTTTNKLQSLMFFSKKKKSVNMNSQLLEKYLFSCISSKIGKSSLVRDFLSVQRDEDRVISKKLICQLVSHHHVTQQTNITKRKRSSVSTLDDNNENQQQKKLMINNKNNNNHSAISMTQFPALPHDSLLSFEENDTKDVSVHEQEPETIFKDNINNYQLIKVLGKGATGKVILVRDQNSHRLFALKTITKSWSITKREVDHIKMERDILTTLSSIHHPFLIRLCSAFQDIQNLYLILDYHPGADLATLLQRFVRFHPEQARLYAAEMVMGLQELHRHHILYRDLKPENVLLASDGHIVLTDFGLSKMFDKNSQHRTTTFCGTPEYLAPEIIQDEEYTYAADFWSLGTMLYEMLVGFTPFAAEEVDDMYERVLFDDLVFPRNFDPEAMDLITGLLDRIPEYRLGSKSVFELRTHPYFANHFNWKDVHAKRITPIYIPSIANEYDFSHFDQDFLDMSTHIKEENDEAVVLRQRWLPESCPAGLQENAFLGYSYIDTSFDEDIPYESEISFVNTSGFLDYDEDDDIDQIIRMVSNHQSESLLNDDPFYSDSSSSSSIFILQDKTLKSTKPMLMTFNNMIRNSSINSFDNDHNNAFGF